MSPFQWAGLSPQLISTLLTKWMGLQEGGRPYGSNFLSLAHSPSNIFQTSTGCPTPKWRLVAKIVYLALCFVSCKMHCCIKSEYVVGDVDGLSKVSTCVFFIWKYILSSLSLLPLIYSPLSHDALLSSSFTFNSSLSSFSHPILSHPLIHSPLLFYYLSSILLSSLFFFPSSALLFPPLASPSHVSSLPLISSVFLSPFFSHLLWQWRDHWWLRTPIFSVQLQYCKRKERKWLWKDVGVYEGT